MKKATVSLLATLALFSCKKSSDSAPAPLEETASTETERSVFTPASAATLPELPAYSPATRLQLLTTLRGFVHDAYVNYPTAVPANHDAMTQMVESEFNALNSGYASLSNADFHKRIAKIFRLFKDGHASYILPYPYQCARNVFPLSFYTFSEDASTSKVYSLGPSAWFTRYKSAKELDGIKWPAEIVSLDDVPTEKLLQNTDNGLPHANPDYAIYLTLYKNGNTDVLPNRTEFRVTLKDANGDSKSVTVPAFVANNKACLEAGKKNVPSSQLNPSPSFVTIADLKNAGAFLSQSGSPLNKTSLEICSKEEVFDMGKVNGIPLMRVGSFFPGGNPKTESCSTGRFLDAVVSGSAAFPPSSDNNALIIDLRGNGGGSPSLAWWLASWIKGRFVPINNTYMRKSTLMQSIEMSLGENNRSLFTPPSPWNGANPFTDKTPNSSLVEFQGNIVSDSDLAPLLPTNSPFSRSKIVVLADDVCASACEFFSSLVQDDPDLKARTQFIAPRGITMGLGAAYIPFENLAALANNPKNKSFFSEADLKVLAPLPGGQSFHLPMYQMQRLSGGYYEFVGVAMEQPKVSIASQLAFTQKQLAGDKVSYLDDPLFKAAYNRLVPGSQLVDSAEKARNSEGDDSPNGFWQRKKPVWTPMGTIWKE